MTNESMAPLEQIRHTDRHLPQRHDSLSDIRGLGISGRRRHTRVEKRALDVILGGSGGSGNKDRTNNNRSNRLGSSSTGGSKGGSRFNFFGRNRDNRSTSVINPPRAAGTDTSRAPEASPARGPTPVARSMEESGLSSREAASTAVFSSPGASSISSPETVPRPTALPAQSPSSLLSSSSPQRSPNTELAVIVGASGKGVLATQTGTLASASLAPNKMVTTTISALPQKETDLATKSFANTALPSSLPNDMNPSGGMSPLAERLLIAAGTIGAFVVIMAAIYVILRIKHKDPFSLMPSRKARKPRSAAKYGRREQNEQSMNEAPPSYSDGYGAFEKPAHEKNVPSQRALEAFGSPNLAAELAIPARIAMFSSANARQQESRQELPASTGERFGSSRAPDEIVPALPAELDTTEVKSGLLSKKLSDFEDYNNTGTQNRPISDSYNLTGTQVTLLTRQTSNINYADQRETNRVSQLSSLSSGFGDGLMTTDGGPLPYGTVKHQSRPQRASRFSWQTSNGQRTPGLRYDRSSTLTTSSIDSAPRFRSVGSWVAYQSGREERRQKKAVGVANGSTMPAPLRKGQDHQRKDSEIAAFRQHPGEEIEMRPGSRVASSILDKKLGHR